MKEGQTNTNFKRNLTMMISGSSLAQIMTLATAPLLTRLYTPEDFGLFAIFNVFTSILGLFVSLRFENAIMLPKDDETAYQVLCLSFLSTLILSLFCGPLLGSILLILQPTWLHQFPLWTTLVPLWIINIAMNSCALILIQWNNRKHNYSGLVKRVFIERLTNIGLTFSLAFWLQNFWGLIVGQIVGALLSNLYLLWLMIPIIRKYSKPKVSQILTLAREYKDFPLNAGWASVFQLSAWQLPQLFIGSVYSVAMAGQYNLAIRMLEAPITLFANTFSTLYYRKMSSENPSRWAPLIGRTLKLLLSWPIIPVALLMALAPTLFSLVFGQQWEEAGWFCSILSILYWFRLVYTTQTPMFAIFRRLDMDLKFSIAMFVSQMLAVAIGYYGFNSLEAVAISMSSLTSLIFIFGCYWVWRYAQQFTQQN